MKKYHRTTLYAVFLALYLFGFIGIKSFVRHKNMALFSLPDGIDLKFAHAVNSQSKLTSTLTDSTVMVLEADVLEDPVRNVPIMAHPPATTSDISLVQFLTQVLLHSPPKGIKLDFKQIEIVEPSLKILDSFQKKYQRIPVVLNADILAGPEDPPNLPLNASRFLELCSNYGQGNMLSLGWTTTNARVKGHPKGYTWEMVQEMSNLVRNLEQKVTFPVRASLVAESREQLLWLLNQSSEHSLTVWHGKADVYDVENMAFLRARKYISKVYYDLPDEKIIKLKGIPVT